MTDESKTSSFFVVNQEFAVESTFFKQDILGVRMKCDGRDRFQIVVPLSVRS